MNNREHSKIRLAVIGAGWRAHYYIRIANALPDLFERPIVLVRNREKAEALRAEEGLFATERTEEVGEYSPHLIVCAVRKGEIFDASLPWLMKGFKVLRETPAAMSLAELVRIRDAKALGAKYLVAEQYCFYPEISAMLQVLRKGLIGDPYMARVSYAHEYHGANLIRAILNTGIQPFRIAGERYSFPVTGTLTRYEACREMKSVMKPSDICRIVFENGKLGLYFFNSEQYRSPIRANSIHVLGERGEFRDGTFSWVDEKMTAHRESLVIEERTVCTDDPNPNFAKVREILKITFGGETVYEKAYSGKAVLSQDEAAILSVMLNAVRGPENAVSLEEMLEDAYTALLMREAIETGAEVRSWRMPCAYD